MTIEEALAWCQRHYATIEFANFPKVIVTLGVRKPSNEWQLGEPTPVDGRGATLQEAVAMVMLAADEYERKVQEWKQRH